MLGVARQDTGHQAAQDWARRVRDIDRSKCDLSGHFAMRQTILRDSFRLWWGNQCPLWVKSRHVQRTSRCPLCANSRHSLARAATALAKSLAAVHYGGDIDLGGD